MAGRRLVVFPADPLFKYFEKGEIKARYWNPLGLFEEVHILSLAPRDIAAEKVQELVGDARLHIHPIGRPTMWSLPLFFPKVRRLVARINPDLIRAHGPWHTGSLAVSAGRALDIPVLVSVHSDRDAQRVHEPSLLLQLVRPLENYTLRNATAVICVSNYLHAYAARHGAKNTYTVYNKVYTRQFERRGAQEGQGRLRVLSVMRLDRAKDPACLIEALAGLDMHLTLIGQGELEADMKQLVKERGMVDQVEFVPRVPNGEIHEYYHAADLFAMATNYEGFCIPVLEAMASSLPVVASNTGPIPEIIGGCGLVVEKDPASFRRAIVELAADPARCRAMGAQAAARARAIDGERMEEREARLYEVVMERCGEELARMLKDPERFVN